MIKFKILKAEDYCDSVRDGTHDSPKKTDSGYKLITSKHIKEYGLDLDSAYCISEKDFNKVNERSAVNINDILYSMIGTIGLMYRVESQPNYAIKNMGLFKISDEIKSKWLYYYLKLPKTQNYIKSLLNGSTQQYITLSNLRQIPIEMPENKGDMKKIIKVLDLIDKKIQINTKTNDNLYELGDALYKEYYSKYENELPNGYKYLDLNEVSVNFDSKRKPMSSREREQHKGIYPYYGATSIIDYVDDYIFDDTYLLMGEDGTVKTNEGYPVLQYIWEKSCINNHTHVLQGTIISTEHLMFALRKKNIETLITGAVQPKINQENMNKIKIIIATDDINIKFEEQIKTFVDKIKFNSIENITLTQLRNTLLPKLMNGKIDLNKIEV